MKNIIYVFLGVFIFSCDEYDPNSGTPKVDIHDVAILDGSTFFTNSLTLSWEGNEFASDFSYRLEPLDYDKIVGIDTAWSEWSIDTSVTLTYLNEGNYNFYVKSRFNLDTEEDIPEMVSFTIDAVTGPALRMYPLYQEVTSGSSCDIYLYLEEVENLVGMELDISYNTAVISGIEITKGDLLANASAFFTDPEYSDGVMRIIASPENFTVLNGDGAVAKLSFTVTGSDTLSFLQSSVFKDSDNHPIEILERVGGIIEVIE